MGKVNAQIFSKEGAAQALILVSLFSSSVGTGVVCHGSRLLFSHVKNGEENICNFHTSIECCEDLMSYLWNLKFRESL